MAPSRSDEQRNNDRGRFYGYARVELASLDYGHQTDSRASTPHRCVSEQNVRRLDRIFRIEGCHRSVREHFVKAEISKRLLHEIQEAHSETPAVLREEPERWEAVPILQGFQLRCFNGLHRILAAKQFLDPNDQWWIVELYNEGLPSASRLALLEEYQNEQAFSDGEIFYKIRFYHKQGAKHDECRWWARLSSTKRKDLRQLLKDDKYSEAFDSLLPWHGLWKPIKLGSLHRLLTMKCDEEILSYLRHIFHTWSFVMGSTGDSQLCVTAHTVKQLECLAPGIATNDAAAVRRLMLDRDLFPGLDQGTERELLLRRFLDLPSFIPSLYTFFEDLKYLEPCAKIMRGLLPTRPKRSIKQLFFASYFQPATLRIEHARGNARKYRTTSIEDDRELSYQQLWLFAMRNFASMTDSTPRKEPTQAKPKICDTDGVLWQDFGCLAWDLGFRLQVAEELKSQDVEKQLAGQLLSRLMPSDIDGSAVEAIAQVLKSVNRPHSRRTEAVLGSLEPLNVERRCGRPFQNDHAIDQQMLFLPQISSPLPHAEAEPTSFFFRRELCRIVLGVQPVSRSELKSCHFGIADNEQQALPDELDSDNASPMRESGRTSACGRCSSYLAELDDIRSQFSRQEQHIADKLRVIEELRRARGENAHTIGQLREELSEKNHAAEVLRSDFEAQRTQLEARLANAERLDVGRKKHIHDQLSAENNLRDQLRRARSECESKARAWASERSQNQEAMLKLRTEISNLQKIRSNAQQEVEDFREAKEQLESQLDLAKGQCEASSQRVDTLNEAIQSLQNNVIEKDANIADYQRHHAELTNQIADLEARIRVKDDHMQLGLQLAQSEFTQLRQRHDFAVARLMAEGQHITQLLHESQTSLVEIFEQLAKERLQYAFTVSNAKRDNDFLVLRFLYCQENGESNVCDWVQTPEAAQELLQTHSQYLHMCKFWIGMDQKALAYSGVDYIFESWREGRVLWIALQRDHKDVAAVSQTKRADWEKCLLSTGYNPADERHMRALQTVKRATGNGQIRKAASNQGNGQVRKAASNQGVRKTRRLSPARQRLLIQAASEDDADMMEE